MTLTLILISPNLLDSSFIGEKKMITVKKQTIIQWSKLGKVYLKLITLEWRE